MKPLRRLSVALVFIVSLSIPAFADGGIETTITSPPPSSAQATTTDGGIDTGVTGQAETGSSETTSTDSATTEAALNLLQSVLSLF